MALYRDHGDVTVGNGDADHTPGHRHLGDRPKLVAGSHYQNYPVTAYR